MRLSSIYLAVILAGCGGNGDTATDAEVDADGDGYLAADDCDDNNADAYPGGDEVCDGADNDCDGITDNATAGLTTYHPDIDGDGYGNGLSSKEACDPPDGYVADGSDCDDGQAQSYPGADEVCDQLDNDCNGEVDDNAVDAETHYFDQDGDGYGDDKTAVVTCSPPANYITIGGDCDDQDAYENPGSDEVCDGIDNNCNDEIDELGAVDGTPYYTDKDGDGYGDDDTMVLSCAELKGAALIGFDCDDSNEDVNPASPEVCDYLDNNCDGDIDEGVEMTFYLDQDGDGYGTDKKTTVGCEAPSGYASFDGDCEDDDEDYNPGEVDFFNDAIDHDCDDADGATRQLSDLGAIITNDSSGLLGYKLEICDIDNDGFGDLVVTSPFDSTSFSYAGGAFVYYGANASTWTGSLERSDADTSIVPSGMFFGFSLACDDFDGDGYDDLAVGTGEIDYSTYQTDFEVYIFSGSAKGLGSSLTESDATGSLLSEWGVPDTSATVYSTSIWTGDADGDGDAELFVNMSDFGGAFSYADGDIWVVDPDGVSTLGVAMIDYQMYSITPDTADAVSSLVAADDYDGDGANDLLIGQYTFYDADTKETPGLLSWLPGAGDDEIAALEAASVMGDQDESYFGVSSTVGDFDGDGLTDLVVGGHGFSLKKQTLVGSLYTFSDFTSVLDSSYLSAGTAASADVIGGYDTGLLGTWVSAIQDIDFDGGNELVALENYGGDRGYGMLYTLSGGGLSGSGLSIDDIKLLEWEGPGGSLLGQDEAVGDLDGDGYDDIVISGRNGNDGTVWIILSSAL